MTRENDDLDALLLQTLPRASVPPPSGGPRKPLTLSLKEWASSQVSAYRVGLVLGYITMMYFGMSAFVAGVPTFEFTTPQGWTPIWSTIVIFGGLIAAIGAIRAGSEPVTREVKIFNRIELTGAVMLFITLGTYAAILLILSYGYSDPARASVGAGFVALGIHPTIRMLWLIFRPRFLKLSPKSPTGPVVMVPDGHALFRVDGANQPIEIVATARKDRADE